MEYMDFQKKKTSYQSLAQFRKVLLPIFFYALPLILYRYKDIHSLSFLKQENWLIPQEMTS